MQAEQLQAGWQVGGQRTGEPARVGAGEEVRLSDVPPDECRTRMEAHLFLSRSSPRNEAGSAGTAPTNPTSEASNLYSAVELTREGMVPDSMVLSMLSFRSRVERSMLAGKVPLIKVRPMSTSFILGPRQAEGRVPERAVRLTSSARRLGKKKGSHSVDGSVPDSSILRKKRWARGELLDGTELQSKMSAGERARTF